jgi:hypothetical protein
MGAGSRCAHHSNLKYIAEGKQQAVVASAAGRQKLWMAATRQARCGLVVRSWLGRILIHSLNLFDCINIILALCYFVTMFVVVALLCWLCRLK